MGFITMNSFIKLLVMAFLSYSYSATADFESLGPYRFHSKELSIPNPIEPERVLTSVKTYPLEAEESYSVILLPGSGLRSSYYRSYAEHLASHGMTVYSLDFLRSHNRLDGEHPYKARQVIMLMDYLSSKEFGILGHSLGAKIAYLASYYDHRVKTIFAMDPVNSGGPPCFISPRRCFLDPVAPNPNRGQTGLLKDLSVSSLIMRSEPDRFLNPEEEFNADRFFYGIDQQGTLGAPSPVVYYNMGRRSHALYVPRLSWSHQQMIKRTFSAWFDQELRGHNREEYLTGDIIQEDIDLGMLEYIRSR